MSLTFSVLNDLGLAGLHDSDAGVGSSEVDSHHPKTHDIRNLATTSRGQKRATTYDEKFARWAAVKRDLVI